jgi:hypothetical protein
MSQPKLTISNSPATGGLVAIQTDAATFAVLTSGTIMPTYVGTGAPSATTLVTGAYYKQYSQYLDITTPTSPVLWICTTTGDKTSSVWAKITGSSGGGWNWLGLYNPATTYSSNDVVQMGVGTSAGMYLSILSPNTNAPDSGIGWVQISTSAGTWL